MAKTRLQKQLETEALARQHGYEAVKNPERAAHHRQRVERLWAKAIRLAHRKGK